MVAMGVSSVEETRTKLPPKECVIGVNRGCFDNENQDLAIRSCCSFGATSLAVARNKSSCPAAGLLIVQSPLPPGFLSGRRSRPITYPTNQNASASITGKSGSACG